MREQRRAGEEQKHQIMYQGWENCSQTDANSAWTTWQSLPSEIRLSKRLVAAVAPGFVMPSTCNAVGATRDLVWHLNTWFLTYFSLKEYSMQGKKPLCRSEWEECGNACNFECALTFIWCSRRSEDEAEGRFFLGELKQTPSIIHEIPWMREK